MNFEQFHFKAETSVLRPKRKSTAILALAREALLGGVLKMATRDGWERDNAIRVAGEERTE